MVDVVVVNWNGRRWLSGCLSSLLAQSPRPSRIILVDNASTDDSVDFVRRTFPDIEVCALPENIGFAAGNNSGARLSTSPYLAFLNNDTSVRPGWLAALLAPVERGDADLATSQLIYMDRPDCVDSAGDGYLRCGGAFKHWHGGSAATAPGSREVFGACGAAFLIRRELFERLGGFDEDFFMVYEDVDLSYRARLTGARVVYAAGAVVEHAGSASMGRVSRAAVYYGQRNMEWTWLKNTPTALLWWSLPAHTLYNLAGALAYARQGRLAPWLRGKLAALVGLRRVLAERRRWQAARVVSPDRLWELMEPDWVAIKRREKDFDFSGGRPPHSPSN